MVLLDPLPLLSIYRQADTFTPLTTALQHEDHPVIAPPACTPLPVPGTARSWQGRRAQQPHSGELPSGLRLRDGVVGVPGGGECSEVWERAVHLGHLPEISR